jgi:hypothetical protein
MQQENWETGHRKELGEDFKEILTWLNATERSVWEEWEMVLKIGSWIL